MRTKRYLLAQIKNGVVSVAAIHRTNTFRVALPDDPDENGVWLPLAPDQAFAVEEYTAVRALVAGRTIRLTRREADLIADAVAATMKMRQGHVRRPMAKSGRSGNPGESAKARDRGGS